MLGNGAFSKEEVERLMKAPNILADFFKRSSEVGWTVAAEQIRSTYWEIETHATRLRRMAKGWMDNPSTGAIVGSEAKNVLNAAADELDRLAKMSVRRPISELRQEAFGRGRESGPDRLILGWFKSGVDGSPEPRFWIARPMRLLHSAARPAGWWADECGQPTFDTPTHFSELPRDEH